MVKIENDCCGCAVPLYPCLGESCPRRAVPHYYCDRCKGEFEPEELYVNEADEELCTECFLSAYLTVKERER